MVESMIYCCECQKDTIARLTDGREIYPNRRDLYVLPFWKCDVCKNYVGCHHKTSQRTKPLGNIPNNAIRNARKHIHTILDPLWKGGNMRRKEVYALISEAIGKQYHTAEIKTVDEARQVYSIVKGLIK